MQMLVEELRSFAEHAAIADQLLKAKLRWLLAHDISVTKPQRAAHAYAMVRPPLQQFMTNSAGTNRGSRRVPTITLSCVAEVARPRAQQNAATMCKVHCKTQEDRPTMYVLHDAQRCLPTHVFMKRGAGVAAHISQAAGGRARELAGAHTAPTTHLDQALVQLCRYTHVKTHARRKGQPGCCVCAYCPHGQFIAGAGTAKHVSMAPLLRSVVR